MWGGGGGTGPSVLSRGILVFLCPVLFSFTSSTSYGSASPSPAVAAPIKTVNETPSLLSVNYNPQMRMGKSQKWTLFNDVYKFLDHLSVLHSDSILYAWTKAMSGLICWPYNNLGALWSINYQRKKIGKQFVCINLWTHPWSGHLWDRGLWLEESGGVHWISSFVMEYSFLWLSALTDHVDLCCIECDNRTMHPAHREMPGACAARAGDGLSAQLLLLAATAPSK